MGTLVCLKRIESKPPVEPQCTGPTFSLAKLTDLMYCNKEIANEQIFAEIDYCGFILTTSNKHSSDIWQL